MEKNRNTTNGLLTRKDLVKLAGIHDAHCVSIYVPTSRAGQEVDRKHAQVHLKNLLGDVRRELKNHGLKDRDMDRLLSGAVELLEDLHFWRHQSDGLAIFIHGPDMQYYTLPVPFEAEFRVSDHFYLVPLIPFFRDNGTYYLLALSQQHVKLYECDRDHITETALGGDSPGRLEDVVGWDYEDKSLQHRTGHGGDSGAMFHGQGSGKDDRDKEIVKFFRAVDTAVREVTGEDGPPLVLACDEQYYPVFREVTKYGNLMQQHVSGTPDEADPLMLHEESWDLVRDEFTRPRDEKRTRIRAQSATGKAIYGVEDIIPAAVDGRVDTLFLREGTDVKGIYDQEERNVIRDDGNRESPVSLFNMAAVHTLLNNGQVYLEPEGNMPMEETEINALLRYAVK